MIGIKHIEIYMNNSIKTIVIIVVFLVVVAGGYFVYAQYFSKSAVQKKADQIASENEEIAAVVLENKKTELVKTLTEDEKADLYNLASSIYEDCKGWNRHDMSLYTTLEALPNAKFLYFVQNSYPSFDSKSLKSRLLLQDFSMIKDKSKGGWTEAKAMKIITAIVYRIENFKV